MGTYLGYIQTVADRLSVESLADMMLNLMQSKKLLENPSTVIFSGFNEQSIDSSIQVISRVVFAYFIYPRVAPIASLFNASIGVIHLGIGFTKRFRTQEVCKNESKVWQEIALNIHKGFAHLLVAVYDYGISYLLRKQYFDIAGVVAFSAFPVVAKLWHERVYKKPGDAPSTSDQKEKVNIKELSEKISSTFQSNSNAESIKSILEDYLKPTPLPSTPTPNVIPKYLTPTCYIYMLAKKITLELMPPVTSQPESFPVKLTNSAKRLSFVYSNDAPVLPEFGL